MHSSQSVRLFGQYTIAANFEMSLSAPNNLKVFFKFFFFFIIKSFEMVLVKERAQEQCLLPSNVLNIGYSSNCACINVDFREIFETNTYNNHCTFILLHHWMIFKLKFHCNTEWFGFPNFIWYFVRSLLPLVVIDCPIYESQTKHMVQTKFE